MTPARPLHLRASSIGLVFGGGVLGTAARQALTLAVPDLALLPLALLICNLTGALLLGVLLEALARRGPDVGGRRALRLCLGTGVMGGFTSYSSLALAVVQLLRGHAPLLAIGYGLGSVLLGVLAAAAGVALAARHRARVLPGESA